MATNRKQDNAANPPQKQSDGTYASRSHRISKEDLYILLALFMEDFPLETEEGELAKQREEKKYRKVGAALVLPNDKIFAIDCTRNGVHGVARLLMEHQDVVKDCKIFVSRKPCSFCTKLLVQSKVKEIFYLPIEPEYHQDGQETEEKKKAFENEKLRVDELFRVSAISQKVFVPGAGLKEVKNKKTYHIPLEKQQKSTKELLMKKYWKGEWLENVRDNLPWPSFDHEMEVAIDADFRDIIDWAAKIALVPGSTKIEFEFQRVPGGGTTTDQVAFNPGRSNETDNKQAAAFITLARFLAEQTDDPKRGVGAVIIQGNGKNRKVVGLGWNGFPSKAVYGQFPRASDDDKRIQDKKYPYIIHAEQNALLMRNTKSITDGILFVTKTPCSECTPLLEMQGIKTVVLGTNLEKENKKSLGYQKFSDKVEEGTFNCFEMKKGW